MANPQDYNKTLNLPQTDFDMRAGLPKKEPGFIKHWNAVDLYENMVKRNEGKPKYVLHDGPPYANGDIHMGTALNKVLKDMIVKYKNMSGFQSPYVPGWDTHGLPTELKALKKIGVDKNGVPVPKLREICREFAMGYVETQKEQFIRLGVTGDFKDPYITLKPEFEAEQIRVFGKMAEKGMIYRGLKPVYWCAECGTALAEAEIEYNEDPCTSIYVKFKVTEDKGLFEKLGVPMDQVYFVIWTTTTWTIPGNLAICLNPEFDYTLVHVGNEYYVMATELAPVVMQKAGITDYEMVGHFTGAECEYMKTRHPLYDRVSLVINGDHVTLDSGTGCVHTAPGFGADDFIVCQKYEEIPIIVPVDAEGRQTEETGPYAGMKTAESNKPILEDLRKCGALLATEEIVHQYPHCWRCKEPVMFRATKQWFCSVDAIKEDAVKAINDVEWIPQWGRDRITSMVRDRNDWCISRQRRWGVPIPVLYCDDCGEAVVNEESIEAIAQMFKKEGSDSWYLHTPEYFLPETFACPKCGCKHFTQEQDILDVWFDSGTTHFGVLKQRPELTWPADLYLEGADQYRGWFQSSLLTAVASGLPAPYKAVCTHGWVVDGEGKQMHKSAGNAISPSEVIDQYGADIFRLWVASSDYHSDIRVSKEIIKQLTEAYRKIRNTARYILGNISDFDPNTDAVSVDQLTELDRWAYNRLDEVIKEATAGYEAFDFHVAFHAVLNYCTVDMSSFYLDIIKDRLYCEEKTGVLRRAAQTTIYDILTSLVRLIAPILVFTSEEIWQHMPVKEGLNKDSVFYNDMPKPFGITVSAPEKWETLETVRPVVQKALEEKRAAKVFGKSLEAKVTLTCSGELYDTLKDMESELSGVFIVSQVALENGDAGDVEPAVLVDAERAEGGKCERCWKVLLSVGSDAEHPTLCPRCARVVKFLL